MGEKVSRRRWLEVVGGTIVGLAVGAGAGYFSGMAAVPPEVERTVTVTPPAVTKTVPGPTVTVTPPGPAPAPITVVGRTVAERAINGVKELVKAGVVPKNAALNVFAPHPLKGCHEDTKAAWESATGIKLNISTVPMGELYEKLMLEAVARTGVFDVFDMKPYWFGDLAADLLTDITDWVRRYDPRMHGEPDGIATTQDWQQSMWKNRYYAIPIDNDSHYAYYRKDLLADPKEQEAFEKQYGYPLKVPETWQQYHDCAEFFYRPPDLYGVIEERNPIYQGLPAFLMRHASKKWPVNYLFDEDMNPTLDTPEGIEAAEENNALIPFMPEGITAWTIGEVYGFYSKGKAFENINFPSFMKAQQVSPSVVIGKVTAATPPGTPLTVEGKTVVNRKTVGNLGFTTAVSKYSKYPELAYLYVQFFTDPENTVIESVGKGSWMDPLRYNQFTDPRQIKTHTIDLLSVAAATTRQAVPFFPLKGAEEYITALARNLVSMYVGDLTPENCLKATTKKWNEITDSLGREEQKESWKFVMETYYPK